MKKRFTDEQIIAFLKEAGTGISVKNLCRKHGFSDASFYQWRRRFADIGVPRSSAVDKPNAKKPST